jgi:hypothetical protein
MGRAACSHGRFVPIYCECNRVRQREKILKKLAAALVLGCALLATGVAGATTGRIGSGARSVGTPPIVWGVADDASKYADDGGSWFYNQLKGANLSVNRWTLAWNPSTPSQITELPFLQRAAPKAQAAGVRVELALYSTQAGSHDASGFCTWAAVVAGAASAYGIHDFIVWNEPNTRLYWTPQKDANGADVAAGEYEGLLATCYDAIHGADPSANVIGMGLSPRASTSDSTEPLAFLRDVGKAYRASGRQKPIMDQLSIHPYPNPNSPTDSPDVGYQVLDRFGISNLDRVKQAVYDAFGGTNQRTTLDGLTFVIDEVGWQTDTSDATKYPQYVNQENVAVVSEQTQADYLKKMATKYFACDPTVTMVNLFLLADETYRNGKDATGKFLGGGWQSGLETAGGQGVSQPKASYAQVGPVFGQGRAACTGPQIAWTPKGGVTGGNSAGGDSSPSATAGDPDGVISPEAQSAFAAAVASLGTQQAALPPLDMNTTWTLGRIYESVLFSLVNGWITSGGTSFLMSVFFCAPNQVVYCTPQTVVNSAFAQRRLAARAAGPAVIATARATAKAGAKPLFVVKNAKKKVKLNAGTYVLALVGQNTTDPTKKYAVAIKLRSVGKQPVAKPKHAPTKQKKK